MRQNTAGADDKKRLTYVLGDIHGCYDELMLLEEKIRAHAAERAAEAFIVSVGDLIDRGPNPLEVVKHFYRCVNAGTHAVVAGNHEQCYLQSLLGEAGAEFEARALPSPKCVRPEYLPGFAGEPLRENEVRTNRIIWHDYGGVTMMKQLGADRVPSADWFMDEHLMQFLCELPLVWFNDAVLVTHALVDRHHAEILKRDAELRADSFTSDEYFELLRFSLWSRDLPVVAADTERINISGHTPMKSIQREPDLNLLRIDTGCVYGDLLTAWCAETDEFLQQPAKKAYWG